MLDIVETMKAEAEALKGEFVSWREFGDYLINCRQTKDGFEWRKITGAASRGAVITEKTARRLLER